ncbi:MAG TPA: sensor domain-containing protein [Phototrophicaceae bacterium]|nr:sensor domain-containing protein [Phototrophicaceae bacterium]
MNNYTWLDALSDGKMLRSWLALFANFWFGLVYFCFIVAGFAVALSLSIVLIGVPLLLFMLSATRTLATLDRKVMAAILDVDAPPDFHDVDPRGANLGERLGLYLGSGATWRSALYLLAKLPIGLLALSISMLILLPLAVEVLILAPLTVDLHLITVRLMRWSSLGLYRLNNWLLPSGKLKRRSRLERVEDELEDDPRYYVDSEGEVAVAKRGR